jgi:hypothetical protein
LNIFFQFRLVTFLMRNLKKYIVTILKMNVEPGASGSCM